jgi:hypothetical protein
MESNVTSSMIKLSLGKRHSNDFYLTEVKTGSTAKQIVELIEK